MPNKIWNSLMVASGLFSIAAHGIFAPANRPIDVQHYRIKLALDPKGDPREFRAESQIKLKTLSAAHDLTLDVKALEIEKVEAIQPLRKKLTFKVSDDKLKISLPNTSKPDEMWTLEITYRGKIQDSHDGFFRVTDPDDSARGPLYFTHFEALSARRFFPCNDEPYDKATTEFLVSVPVSHQVVSNGRLVNTRKFKKEGKPWQEVQWLQEKPHSTYLVSLAVAPFAKVTSPGEPEVSIWVGPKKIARAQFAAYVTRKEMEFFEGYYKIPYPWKKYATVGLPTYLWGGMENTSATTMNEERMLLNDLKSEAEKYRVVGLTSHELAHQWFGDLVTMKWWDDIWLNEAFASYMATLATKHLFNSPQAEIDTVTDAWHNYFKQEDGPRSHAIVDKQLDNPEEAFDSISYTKGENVLRMLSYYIGEGNFRKGVTEYMKTHALGNATYLDLFAAFEKSSGTDLKKFRDTWLLQRGYPIVAYSGTWDVAKSKYVLKITQRSNHPESKDTFVFRLPVVFHRKSAPAYAKEIQVASDQAIVSTETQLPAAPEWITVNPGAVVLAKVIPEVREENAIALQATQDPDPIARVWAAYALSEGLFADGKLSPLAEKTLGQMAGDDASPYVRVALFERLQRAKSRWLPTELGNKIYALALTATTPEFGKTPAFRKDAHGWSQYRSGLIATLGRVQKPEVMPFLGKIVSKNSLGLDDLDAAALAIAMQADPKTPEALKAALKVHQRRGYRYRFAVQNAYGAIQSPMAVPEIKELTLTCGADLIGRIGRLVRDNEPLKTSPEWSVFLREFILTNDRFGDEVKSRVLRTVEDVKTADVKSLLQAIEKESKSERMKQVSQKMREKMFGEANT